MLNKKEKQHYTKEDIESFDMLSNFKKNNNDLETNIIQNDRKIEEKYTINDYNNFNLIIENCNTYDVDHDLNFNSQKHKNSDYNKNDLKNFEKFDNQVYGYTVNNEDFENHTKSTKIVQINYKKKDLENFNQIIKNDQNLEKNSLKIVNLYESQNSKLKKESLNLKKIKILYFD